MAAEAEAAREARAKVCVTDCVLPPPPPPQWRCLSTEIAADTHYIHWFK